jgi:cytochrome P450
MADHEPRYDVDFNRPELIVDPFPAYEEIRARGRAVWNEYLKGWMVTGYDDVVAVHADAEHFSSAAQQSSFFEAPTMISTDPPEHTRLRAVAKQAFTKRSVTSMRAAVERVVEERVAAETVAEALRTGSPFDFAKEVSAYIPTLVIADILGVSRADRADFRQWSMELTLAVDYGLSPDAEQRRQRGREAASKVNAYFREQIAARRARPRDDLMTDLVWANEHEQLSTEELSATCLLLLIAGNDTTNKMISGMFLLLGQHRDERHRVLEAQALVDPAVEEAVRMMALGQATPRRVSAGVDGAGRHFEEGEMVWMMKAAANRDPAQFPDPSRFDVARTPNHHLGFGWGIHLCLGIHLARMELQATLARLLPHIREFDVVDFRFEPSYHVRGLESLVIAPMPAPVPA